jgi:hypothetical protein
LRLGYLRFIPDFLTLIVATGLVTCLPGFQAAMFIVCADGIVEALSRFFFRCVETI